MARKKKARVRRTSVRGYRWFVHCEHCDSSCCFSTRRAARFWAGAHNSGLYIDHRLPHQRHLPGGVGFHPPCSERAKTDDHPVSEAA